MRPARLLLILAAVLACHHRRAASAQDPPAPGGGAAVLLGTWEYHAVPTADRPTLGMGLHVVIAIDSAAGDQFRGRVTLWLTGDVGADVSAFGPVAGTLAPGGQVTFTIPYARGGAEPIRVRARLAADTLTIDDGPPFTAAGLFLRTGPPTSSR